MLVEFSNEWQGTSLLSCLHGDIFLIPSLCYRYSKSSMPVQGKDEEAHLPMIFVGCPKI